MVRRVEVEGFLQVSKGKIDLAGLHARSRPVHIVLGIVGEEVDGSTELNLSALIVLLVEALGTKGVMSQRETGLDQRGFAAKVQGIMIVREGQVEALKLAVCVTTVQVDAAICWHEVECFVQDCKGLLEPLLLVERCAHVVIR